MAPSSLAIIGWAVVALFVYFVLKSLVLGLMNPLRHLPGPWFARFTNLVAIYYQSQGRVVHYIDSLHKKYGPVVIVAVDTISVADGDAWAYMSRMGTDFLKGSFYDEMNLGPAKVMFTMTDVKQHAARRRLFARAFNLESLRKNWEAAVREQVELAVRQIKRDAEAGTADVYKWWRFMAGDVIGLLSFGETFGMLETGKKTDFFNALVNAGFLSIIGAMLLPFRVQWLRYLLPFKSVRELLRANKVIYDQGTIAVENLRHAQRERPSLFTNALAEAEANEKAELTDDAIRSEAALFMVAGSDTTAFSLTYLTWCVLKRPELQRKIEQEVALLPEGFTDKDVEALTVLNHTIDETLRLYNAGGAFLPRRVPQGGITFCGHYIPEGFDIGSAHLTLSRLPGLFENPDTFDHTRWENITAEQKRSAQPFSLGARNCIGQHLARMEMRLAAATFFREMKGVRIGKAMTDDMMDVRITLTAYPVGGKLDITLLESEAQ